MKPAYVFIIFLLLLAGCIPVVREYHPYKLYDGRTVQCKVASRNGCGVNLEACADGSAYFCQHYVTRLYAVR